MVVVDRAVLVLSPYCCLGVLVTPAEQLRLCAGGSVLKTNSFQIFPSHFCHYSHSNSRTLSTRALPSSHFRLLFHQVNQSHSLHLPSYSYSFWLHIFVVHFHEETHSSPQVFISGFCFSPAGLSTIPTPPSFHLTAYCTKISLNVAVILSPLFCYSAYNNNKAKEDHSEKLLVYLSAPALLVPKHYCSII